MSSTTQEIEGTAVAARPPAVQRQNDDASNAAACDIEPPPPLQPPPPPPQQQQQHQDRSYEAQQQKYLTWVNEQLANGELSRDDFEAHGSTYFRRQYVDSYFEQVIAHWNVKPETVKRAISALQLLADREENAERPPEDRFVVHDSDVVRDAIQSSKRKYYDDASSEQNEMNGTTRKRRGKKNPEDDPHFGLPISPLRDGDKQAFVRHVISSASTNRSDDGMDACLHFTACEQLMVDSSTVLQLTLADLQFNPTMECLRGDYDDDAYENISVLDSGTLYVTRHPSMVTRTIRCSTVTKKKKSTPIIAVVGCLRHQHILQCFTSMAAMTFFVRHRSNRNLFATKNWRDVNLLQHWNDDDPTAIQRTYKDVFDALCIASNRCPHLHPSYMGSLHGELLLASMSTSSSGRTGSSNKRRRSTVPTTTFDAHFDLDVHRRILECMAGFSKEKYVVPRLRLPVETWWPGGMEYITNALFPHCGEWMAKQDDEDNSIDATYFLQKIIPFFAKVIVQDGCFWIDMFSNHEVSISLRNLLPNFERLAAQARQWCENQVNGRSSSSSSNSNHGHEGTAIYQESVTQSLGDLHRQIQELRAAGQQHHAQMRHQQAQMQHLVQQNLQLMRQQQVLLLQQANLHGGGGGAGVAVGGRGGDGQRDANAVRHVGPVESDRGGGPSPRRRQSGGAKEAPSQVPTCLPDVPSSMPESVVELVSIWIERDLNRFVNATKSHWGNPLRNRFSLWKYLVEKVYEKEQSLLVRNGNDDNASHTAMTRNDRLLHAARALDMDREERKLSVPQFLKHLKDSDPSVERRQRS